MKPLCGDARGAGGDHTQTVCQNLTNEWGEVAKLLFCTSEGKTLFSAIDSKIRQKERDAFLSDHF